MVHILLLLLLVLLFQNEFTFAFMIIDDHVISSPSTSTITIMSTASPSTIISGTTITPLSYSFGISSNRHLDASSTTPISSTRLYSSSSSSSSSVPSLYDVQEEAITRRGIFEEELMQQQIQGTKNGNAKDLILKEYIPKIKGANVGGGFGGSSNNKKKTTTKKNKKSTGSSSNKSTTVPSKLALEAQGKAYAKILQQDGVVRIDNILSKKLTTELRKYVMELRQIATKEVESGQVSSKQRFADVLLKQNRCDLTMPFGTHPILYDALHTILNCSPIGTTIAELLGHDAKLYEFSCLISDPGSPRQVIHPDTPCSTKNEEPVLYTCFIALQDVTIDMGPTVWLPGTHTLEYHEIFQQDQPPSIDPKNLQNPKDILLSTHSYVLGAIPQGTCCIFDSRTLHAGTANISHLRDDKGGTQRAIFYVSFQKNNAGYPGNPPSIRPELQNQLSLNILQTELQKQIDSGTQSNILQSIAQRLR